MSDTGVKDAQVLKNTGLLLGWIAGIILIAGFCWFLTQPVRSRLLLRAVNRVLEQSGDPRRLGEPIPSGALSGLGSWYTITANGDGNTAGGNKAAENIPSGTRSAGTGSRAYIFVLIGEGTFFPCAAVVSPEGKVQEYIPLNGQGEQMIKRLSPGILGVYTRRIEGAGS